MEIDRLEIHKAANWFERRYSIRLPPIYLNKSIEFSHYCWGGKYGCVKDYHIFISSQQDLLLAFFHEAEHIRLNKERGRVVQDSEPGVETLVTERAREDIESFKLSA